jgi:transposase
MGERFVNVDRDTPMMLPPDLREWVPKDDMVHFVLEAVEAIPQSSFEVNYRGTGSAQYPPQMLLALLIYCYSQGVFSSRRIERATWHNVAVRYITGQTHPDHDTICTFRRRNAAAITAAFKQVLKLAREMGLLQVGTVSVDGTHMKANASKHRSVRYDRAKELEQQLTADIEELLATAEAADSEEAEDGTRLPEEIARRERLREKMREAQRRLEARESAIERESFDDDDHDGGAGAGGGTGTRKTPRADKQINLTDSDSSLMRKSRRDSWIQGYNAQAVVDADGSQLVLASWVHTSPSDAQQLRRAYKQAGEHGCRPTRMLADGGYANAEEFEKLADNVDLYVAVSSADAGQRRYDFRPQRTKKGAKTVTHPQLVAMQQKLQSDEGKRRYARRKHTVEPAFGIIKEAMGLRQFLLRGLQNVTLEWELVCTAYNLKRLWALRGG